MEISLYQYGDRAQLEGLCLGVARHPPRGIHRDAWSARGFFDAWLPQLAPSAALATAYHSEKIPFTLFSRRYRREMRVLDARRLIELLAEISRHQRINLGCFCADPLHCHRSILRQLIADAEPIPARRRPAMPSPAGRARSCASPPCAMPEITD